MKTIFEAPEMNISMFNAENVVTEPSSPTVPTTGEQAVAAKMQGSADQTVTVNWAF